MQNNLTPLYKSYIESKYSPETIYNIRVKRNNGGKEYFGKLIFYNILQKQAGQAVGESYEIRIPGNYFDEATEGHVNWTCEYYKRSTFNYGKEQDATWIIWISDEPLD